MGRMNWQLLIQHWQVLEMQSSRRLVMIWAGMLFLISNSQVQAADNAVSISNFTFTPAEIKIHIGDTVTFKNEDDIPHQVIASDGSFKGKALDTSDTSVFTFKTAGEFGYFCGLHPHMVGKVIVTP